MVVDAPLPRLDPAVLELGAPGDMRARLVQAVLTGALPWATRPGRSATTRWWSSNDSDS